MLVSDEWHRWSSALLTKKNDGNGDQDHKNVVVSDKRYQTLDADGKANTRSHGFFLWNVLSCLDKGLRPAGGRRRGWRNANVSLHTIVPGFCCILVLTRGMWRFGLPERGDDG